MEEETENKHGKRNEMKDRKVGGRKYGAILHLPGVHLVSISFEGQDHSKKMIASSVLSSPSRYAQRYVEGSGTLAAYI